MPGSVARRAVFEREEALPPAPEAHPVAVPLGFALGAWLGLMTAIALLLT
jgi:hypothetical protein